MKLNALLPKIIRDWNGNEFDPTSIGKCKTHENKIRIPETNSIVLAFMSQE